MQHWQRLRNSPRGKNGTQIGTCSSKNSPSSSKEARQSEISIWGLVRRWLLAHGATEEGERALRELVQGPEYDQMMADLREQAEEQRKHAKVALRKAMVTPELCRQLHIGQSHLFASR